MIIRISALNVDSTSEEDTSNEAPCGGQTAEAQESAAFAVYNEALGLLRKNETITAEDVFLRLLDADFINEAHSSAGDEGLVQQPALVLKYSIHKNLAALCSQRGDDSEAMEHYLQAVMVDASDVTVWFKLGKLALKLGNLLLAKHAFMQALDCNPKHWPSMDQLIPVLYALSNYEVCLSYISQALERDAGFLKGLVFMRQMYKEQPSLTRDYREFFKHCDSQIYSLSVDDEESKGLVAEALKLRKQLQERCKPTENKKIVFTKPVGKLRWQDLGESLIALYDQLTKKPKAMNLCRPLDLTGCIETLNPDQPRIIAMDTPDPDQPQVIEMDTPDPYQPQAITMDNPDPDQPQVITMDTSDPDQPQVLAINTANPDQPQVLAIDTPNPDQPQTITMDTSDPDQPQVIVDAPGPDQPQAITIDTPNPDQPHVIVDNPDPDQPQLTDRMDIDAADSTEKEVVTTSTPIVNLARSTLTISSNSMLHSSTTTITSSASGLHSSTSVPLMLASSGFAEASNTVTPPVPIEALPGLPTHATTATYSNTLQYASVPSVVHASEPQSVAAERANDPEKSLAPPTSSTTNTIPSIASTSYTTTTTASLASRADAPTMVVMPSLISTNVSSPPAADPNAIVGAAAPGPPALPPHSQLASVHTPLLPSVSEDKPMHELAEEASTQATDYSEDEWTRDGESTQPGVDGQTPVGSPRILPALARQPALGDHGYGAQAKKTQRKKREKLSFPADDPYGIKRRSTRVRNTTKKKKVPTATLR